MRRPVTLAAAVLLAAAIAPLAPGIATGGVPEPSTGPDDRTGPLATDSSARTAGGAATVPLADVDRPPAAVATPDNSSTVLDLGPPSATGYTRPTVGLSGALGVQYEGLDARLDNYTIRESFERASSTRARLAVLEAALDRVAERTTALDRRWRHEYAGFANGSVETAAFVAAAGETSARAAARRETVAVVRELVAEVDPDATTEPPATADPDATTDPDATADPDATTESDATIDAEEVERRARVIAERTRTLDADLGSLAGQPGTLVGAALQGHADAGQLYVAANDAGVVTSTVHDGTYYRELHRGDARDGGNGTLEPAEANDLVQTTYPWAWNESTQRQLGVLPDGDFRATIPYPGGTVEAFIDGSSGQVYRERHAMNLSRYPTAPAEEWSQSGLVLRVNETYAGGPLRVTLRDDGGAPLDGQLTVADTVVGRTGDDGVLWTVSPAGRGEDGDVIVTAELDDGTQVSLTYQTLGEN